MQLLPFFNQPQRQLSDLKAKFIFCFYPRAKHNSNSSSSSDRLWSMAKGLNAWLSWLTDHAKKLLRLGWQQLQLCGVLGALQLLLLHGSLLVNASQTQVDAEKHEGHNHVTTCCHDEEGSWESFDCRFVGEPVNWTGCQWHHGLMEGRRRSKRV